MKFIPKHFLILTFLLFGLIGCKNSHFEPKLTDNTNLIHKSINKTTEIIVHDIFSPVVAARIYMYSNVALYETLRQGESKNLNPSPAN